MSTTENPTPDLPLNLTDPALPAKPLTQPQVNTLCTRAGRAVKNMRMIMPFYKDMLADAGAEAEGSGGVGGLRMGKGQGKGKDFDWKLVDGMVEEFGGMWERLCAPVVGTANVNTSGAPVTVMSSLPRSTVSSPQSSPQTQQQQPQPQAHAKPPTTADFHPMALALPFHSLLESSLLRAREHDRVEQEYFRRQAEMAAYVAQVKRYGLAGGRSLKEPGEWWDGDFWARVGAEDKE